MARFLAALWSALLVLLGVSFALVVCAVLWFFLVGPSQKMALIFVPLMAFSLGIQVGLWPWVIARERTLLGEGKYDSGRDDCPLNSP